MNRTAVVLSCKRGFTRAAPVRRCKIMLGAVAIVAALPSFAQNDALQERVAALKQSIAQNTQQLHRYQWIETTLLTLKGDPKPRKQDSCQYGPDGQVQKTPIGPPPEQPSGGRIKERIIEKKKAEMKDYMDEVKGILGMYLPPDPQRIEQAHQAGKISLNPAGGIVNLIFQDYMLPGDQMTISFDPTARKVVSLSVNTFMSEKKDAVTLQVQMASLPDGTNYVHQSVLTASAKHLQVTTINSDYRTVGGS